MSDKIQKSRTVDRDGIEMVMTKKEYLGDACGAASTNCLSMVAGQLTYFYTDRVGMTASAASLVQMIATVPKTNPIVQSIYATLSLVFSRAIVYTAIIIPYYSMITYMTRSMEERGKIGNYRSVFNNAVGVISGESGKAKLLTYE
jgi:GPH family glycoside/pentoside/hexuronide:cation symporter